MMQASMKKMKARKKMSKEEIYRIIDEKTKVISKPTSVYKTVTFIENGFPEKLFKMWKKQCEEQFNDIYWAKIWSDHLKAQAYDHIIIGGVQYSQEVNSTSEKEEKETGPVVFGDGE